LDKTVSLYFTERFHFIHMLISGKLNPCTLLHDQKLLYVKYVNM
jgi:hypothetical protein